MVWPTARPLNLQNSQYVRYMRWEKVPFGTFSRLYEADIRTVCSIRHFGHEPDLRRAIPERPLSGPARLVIPAIIEVSGLPDLVAAGAPGDISGWLQQACVALACILDYPALAH